jgi:archaellum component FlaF (FlaF/FlaG flagellin family)
MHRTKTVRIVANSLGYGVYPADDKPGILPMKTYSSLILGFSVLCSASFCQAQNLASQTTQITIPVTTPYAITAQDANSRVWQGTTYNLSPNGGIVTNIHSYTELNSGLNHLVNGQWVESKEWIDILPNGTAVATNGQHQAYFPGDIYSGQIELVTPDGQHLKSRPMGLSYFDGTNSVLIAELTNSIGIVVGSNQVVYPSAFTDFRADLRYTYTKAGFEQDIILHQQPPTPESVGINPDTARLQILTEFFSPPQPAIQSSALPVQAGLSLTDQLLGFGAMQMIPGRAFLLGQNANDAGALVDKQWLLLNGRQFLVEEVPVDAILGGLAALPLTAMNSNSSKNIRTASKHLKLPPKRFTQAISKQMLIAMADLPAEGFMLDYQIINSTQTNYTFRADTTYEVGGITLRGTNIFEGGSVIKYVSNGSIQLMVGAGNPGIIWKGSAYRPVIFTCVNDNSVGDTISTSTGNPTNFCGNPMLNLATLSSVPTITGIRMNHAITALQFSGASANIYDAQFLNCQYGISGGGANITLRNALYANVNTNFNATIGGFGINAQNVTVSGSRYLLVGSSSPMGVSLTLSNCIFANVTNLFAGFAGPGGSYNGFYASPTFGTVTTGSSAYPFQTAGAGNFYLTNGCSFLNQGTTNVDPVLLAIIRGTTTFPPVPYTNSTVSINTILSPQAQRDTDVPDLGYHYDPIDYIVDQFNITNATLTISSGVAIAGYNEPGIQLLNGSAMVSVGTALTPNWFVRYQSVQEQSIALGGTNVSTGQTVGSPGGASAVFQFSKFACPAGGGYHLCDTARSTFSSLWAQNCEFWSGNNDFSGTNVTSVATLMNDLFWRSTLYASNNSAAATLNLTNNLAFGTTITLSQPGSGLWTAFNNDFDTCTLTNSTLTNGYNAYLNSFGRLNPNYGHDVIQSGALNYQAGPLGNFYQPSTSPLINVGNITADLVGLYHFTVTTNLVSNLEIKETNSIVDIGYHYAAVDINGLPIDTNGDGAPDYLEDANGNGLVDSGEIGWNIFGDLGLKVLITRPRNGNVLP